MKKRILASFLSLVLVLSLVPASALAVEESSEGPAEPTVEEPVEPSEAPAEPEETVCAELEGCVENAHDPACPLYVEPEKVPINDADIEEPTVDNDLPTETIAEEKNVSTHYGATSLENAKALLDGEGTADNPFKVADAEDLYQVNAIEYWNNQQSEKTTYYYQQTSSLDLKNTTHFDNLDTYITETFRGVYDGQRYEISGISKPLFYKIEGVAVNTATANDYDSYTSTPERDYLGLYSAAVCNITLNNPIIGSSFTKDKYTYTVAYEAKYTSFVNIIVNDAELTGSNSQESQIGGLVGWAYWSIFDGCSISMTASDAKNIAGIAGRVFGSTATPLIMVDCSSSGTANMTGAFGGGMTFLTTTHGTFSGDCAYELRIEDCSSALDISTTNEKGSKNDDGMVSIGGIIGRTSNSTLIQDCTYSGTLKYSEKASYVNVGGIVGVAFSDRKPLDGIATWNVEEANLPPINIAKNFYVGKYVGGYGSERLLGWGFNTGSVIDANGGELPSLSSGTTVGDIGGIRMVTIRNVKQSNLNIINSADMTVYVEKNCDIGEISFTGEHLLVNNAGKINKIAILDGIAWQLNNSGIIGEIIYLGDPPTEETYEKNKDYVIQVEKNTGTINKMSIYDEDLLVSAALDHSAGEFCYDKELRLRYRARSEGAFPTMTRENSIFGGVYETSDFSGDPVTEAVIDPTASAQKAYYIKWIELAADKITMEYGSTKTPPTIEGVALTDWTSANPDVVKIENGQLIATGVGDTTITANAAPAATRSGETLTVSVKVTPKEITVSMTDKTETYNEQPHTIEAKPAEGGTLPEDLELVYSYKESNASDNEYIHVAPTHPGAYTVKVESGNPNYKLIGKTNATLMISAPQQEQDVSAQVTVTVPSLVYDGKAKVYTAAYEGITNWTIAYYDTEGEKLKSAPVNAGDYWVTINGENKDKAVYASITESFTITPAQLTVKAVDKTIRVGDQLPEYTYTVSGWQGNDTDDLLSGVTVTCSTADASKAGDYTITVDGPAELANYKVSYEKGTLTVTKRSSGGGSSSSGSSSGDYIVSVDSDKHGTVTVSPKRADKGDTVTITVRPDKGYELDELTATDKSGDTIKIKDKGNGKFTFTMPGSKVTVEASFKQIDAEPEVPAFADVPADAYYADAVAWAVKEGITSGTSATTFTPNASCTRAQMVTFLWRANGSPVVNYAMSFTDVPADAYYAEAVRWAVSEGITTGTTATTFSPDATLTRAQAVTFIYRNVQAQGGGFTGSWMFPCPFTDVPADAYYFESVQWCAMKNITSGTSADTFSPAAPCTRAQIVTFLYRDAQ